MRHRKTLTLKPVARRFAKIYRRRGLNPPDGHSGHDDTATLPYKYRTAHRLYATTSGYFWLPCPRCAEPFGGHEIVDVIAGVCPVCTAEMNGGKL